MERDTWTTRDLPQIYTYPCPGHLLPPRQAISTQVSSENIEADWILFYCEATFDVANIEMTDFLQLKTSE